MNDPNKNNYNNNLGENIDKEKFFEKMENNFDQILANIDKNQIQKDILMELWFWINLRNSNSIIPYIGYIVEENTINSSKLQDMKNTIKEGLQTSNQWGVCFKKLEKAGNFDKSLIKQTITKILNHKEHSIGFCFFDGRSKITDFFSSNPPVVQDKKSKLLFLDYVENKITRTAEEFRRTLL